MHRPLVLVLVLAVAALVAACGSGSSSTSAACPDVAGTWKVTQHCDPTLVGKDAPVTQNGCSLAFGGLFASFTGTVTPDGKISVSGPQSCSGTASASAIAMTCTPGTCSVTLAK